MADNPPPPRRRFSERAERELYQAAAWLQTFSTEAAEVFVDRAEDAVALLREQLEAGFKPQPDEAATLYFSRPVFQHLFSTQERER